jgi:hypothetical protein
MKKNPHMHLVPLEPPPRDSTALWRCVDCQQEDRLDALRARSCTFEHAPCPHCGETPECAIDCPGIAQALSDPSVYIAGTVDPNGEGN